MVDLPAGPQQREAVLFFVRYPYCGGKRILIPHAMVGEARLNFKGMASDSVREDDVPDFWGQTKKRQICICFDTEGINTVG